MAGRIIRPAFWLSAGVLLAGCMDGGDGGFAFRGGTGGIGGGALSQPRERDGSDALREADLAGGQVVAAGPRGYCVDDTTVSRRGGGFALIASCQSLGASGPLVPPAVMTVTVLPRLAGGQDELTAEDITAVMAPAQALAEMNGDGVAFVHLDTGGKDVIPGGADGHWRAAMRVNGYLVGLALYGPEGSPLADDDGLSLIAALSEAVRAASPEEAVNPPVGQRPAPEAPREEGTLDAPKENPLGTMFNGLFRKRG